MQHTFANPVFARLQSHARPFVDTIDDVVMMALDALEAAKAKPGSKVPKSGDSDETVEFSPDAPPSLKHSVPRRLMIDGVDIEKDVYWATLLLEVIRSAASKGWSADKIMETMQSPTKMGDFAGPGYRYVPEANLSFQQLNSDRTWAELFRLARRAGISVMARWTWSGEGTPDYAATMKFEPQ